MVKRVGSVSTVALGVGVALGPAAVEVGEALGAGTDEHPESSAPMMISDVRDRMRGVTVPLKVRK